MLTMTKIAIERCHHNQENFSFTGSDWEPFRQLQILLSKLKN